MQPFKQATFVAPSDAQVKAMARQTGQPETLIRGILEEEQKNSLVFINDVYQVHVRDYAEHIIWLSIRRLDREPVTDWRDKQQIKNELVGPEHEAVELYPAESRLVDSANQYHLWVLKNPDMKFPFGFTERFTLDGNGYDPESNTAQRPLDR